MQNDSFNEFSYKREDRLVAGGVCGAEGSFGFYKQKLKKMVT